MTSANPENRLLRASPCPTTEGETGGAPVESMAEHDEDPG
jgi:hypothetical protein